MIEIVKEQENWVAYIDGALYHYSSNLESLFEYLARRSEDIEEEFINN